MRGIVRKALLAALILVGGAGCGDLRPPVQVPSPDGKHTLVASVNESKADRRKYLCLRIQIVDTQGRVRYEEQTGASSRMAWRASWAGPGRVKLDSSDIGPLAWRLKADGEWERDE
jgi:hypothetical protein